MSRVFLIVNRSNFCEKTFSFVFDAAAAEEAEAVAEAAAAAAEAAAQATMASQALLAAVQIQGASTLRKPRKRTQVVRFCILS